MDTGDKVLLKAFQKKQKHFAGGDSDFDFEFSELLIKSKMDSVIRDIDFLSNVMDKEVLTVGFLLKKFKKVKKVLKFCMNEKQIRNGVDQIKYDFLEFQTRIKQLRTIRDYIGPDRVSSNDSFFIDDSITILDTISSSIIGMSVAEGPKFEDMDLEDRTDDKDRIRGKMIKEASNMAETVLRWFKEKANSEN